MTGEVGAAAALAHSRGPHPDIHVPGAASLDGDAPLLQAGGFVPNPPLGNCGRVCSSCCQVSGS